MSQADKPTEGAFAVWGRSVDEYAGHGAAFLFGWSGVEALADAGSGIAAFQGQLADEGVGEGVEEGIAQTGKSALWRLDETGLPPIDVGFVKLLRTLGQGGTLQPLLDLLLVELDKD